MIMVVIIIIALVTKVENNRHLNDHGRHHYQRPGDKSWKQSPPQWTRCLQPSRSSFARSARCWFLQKLRSRPTHEEPGHGRDDGGGRDDKDGRNDVDDDGHGGDDDDGDEDGEKDERV